MMRYAQINGIGICIGISDLRGQVNTPNMIAISSAENPIGQTWNGAAWEATPVTPKTSGLTENEYYNLFTDTEQALWFDYTDNGTLPPGGVTGPQRQILAVAKNRLQGLMRSGGGIDLEHPLVVSAVNTMATCGFIDAARIDVILSGQGPA